MDKDPSRFRQAGRSTASEIGSRAALDDFFSHAGGSWVEKLENFASYVPRQSLTRFLCLSDIFRLALNVQGDVIECGVNWGGGVMTFAQLSWRSQI